MHTLLRSQWTDDRIKQYILPKIVVPPDSPLEEALKEHFPAALDPGQLKVPQSPSGFPHLPVMTNSAEDHAQSLSLSTAIDDVGHHLSAVKAQESNELHRRGFLEALVRIADKVVVAPSFVLIEATDGLPIRHPHSTAAALLLLPV